MTTAVSDQVNRMTKDVSKQTFNRLLHSSSLAQLRNDFLEHLLCTHSKSSEGHPDMYKSIKVGCFSVQISRINFLERIQDHQTYYIIQLESGAINGYYITLNIGIE